MKIAQVSPLYENVPSHLYGGTERVVGFLTEELVRMGHDVTLYASGDSETSARLVSIVPKALRLDAEHLHEPTASHMLLVERIDKEAEQYDIIHFHIDYLQYPVMRRHTTPFLTTIHGRQDYAELPAFYAEFNDVALVSISDHQRGPLPMANWVRTIYHGLPLDLLQYHEKPQGYLAFLGRIHPAKGPDSAVKIARGARMPLKIAAKLEEDQRPFFNETIAPYLGDSIEFIGEIGDREKNDFLGNASALLFPIDWPEPFGLVMIESMACGTPVVAWREGSVPEVIDEGVSGVIVDNLDDAIAGVSTVCKFDRAACRRQFEQRFTAARMAADYVELYETLIQKRSSAALIAGR